MTTLQRWKPRHDIRGRGPGAGRALEPHRRQGGDHHIPGGHRAGGGQEPGGSQPAQGSRQQLTLINQ